MDKYQYICLTRSEVKALVSQLRSDGYTPKWGHPYSELLLYIAQQENFHKEATE